MLNRRILRIKAFKVLYSFAEDPSMTLAEGESQLETSCEATRSLYLFMLSIIPALADEALSRIEAAKGKFNPTEEERNPNMKFACNALAAKFREDPDFVKAVNRRKLSWDQFDAFIRNTYSSILSKDYFADYMGAEGSDLKQDIKLYTKIFEEEFVDSKELSDILEDLSIWWNDDLAYSLTCCCDSLRLMAHGKGWELPPLYRSEMAPSGEKDSDKAFVTRLLRTSFLCFEKYAPLVAENAEQWEGDRLFTTDLALIVMGLSEAKAFPEMPVRVTINEYVEISKYYSTPKSRVFVNGMLDRLIRKLVAEGEIEKAETIEIQ